LGDAADGRVNQIRSLLLERGMTLPKGRSHVEELLPRILEDADLKLSGSFRVLLSQLGAELGQLGKRIAEMDAAIEQRAREDKVCRRLTTISRSRSGDSHSASRSHRQRSGLSQRARSGHVDRDGSPRMFYGRKAEVVGHQ
jgi:transposase